jgi:phospholipase C
MSAIRDIGICCAIALLTACGGSGGGAALHQIPQANGPTPVAGSPSPTQTPGGSPAPSPTPASLGSPIRHIVVIVQENRSFDDLFGGPNGFPGANTASSGIMSNGQTVALQPVGLEAMQDILHSHVNFEREYAGGKLYFDQGSPSGQPASYPYAYVPYSETQPYWALASQYVLADEMFQSNNGPSFPAHQYLIAGQSGSGSQMADENPVQSGTSSLQMHAWGCDDPSGTYVPVLAPDGQDQNTGLFPCFTYPTLADEMDARGVSWRYYAPQIGSSGAIWSAFDANRQIRYGSDWSANVISPQTQILTDANSTLPQVVWVTPSAADSDHAGIGSNTGPSWVASVVNAIGQGPNWNSTAILITWDDWGGWFDHVPPQQIDAMGLGFRVPLIVVSPYARTAYVSHVPHEFGSVLHFIEQTFGLSALTAVDRRADDLSDCFDFTQAPRAFHSVAAPLRASFFLHRAPDTRTPDDD